MTYLQKHDLFKGAASLQASQAIDSLQMTRKKMTTKASNKIQSINHDLQQANRSLNSGNYAILQGNQKQNQIGDTLNSANKDTKQIQRKKSQKALRIRIAYIVFICVCSFVLLKRILNFKVSSLMKYVI